MTFALLIYFKRSHLFFFEMLGQNFPKLVENKEVIVTTVWIHALNARTAPEPISPLRLNAPGNFCPPTLLCQTFISLFFLVTLKATWCLPSCAHLVAPRVPSSLSHISPSNHSPPLFFIISWWSSSFLSVRLALFFPLFWFLSYSPLSLFPLIFFFT